MTILRNEKIRCASGEMNTLPNNVSVCQSSWLQGTNRKRGRVAEADTTYVDQSVAGVHNKNSDDIWSIWTYSLTNNLCYAMCGDTSC